MYPKTLTVFNHTLEKESENSHDYVVYLDRGNIRVRWRCIEGNWFGMAHFYDLSTPDRSDVDVVTRTDYNTPEEAAKALEKALDRWGLETAGEGW